MTKNCGNCALGNFIPNTKLLYCPMRNAGFNTQSKPCYNFTPKTK